MKHQKKMKKMNMGGMTGPMSDMDMKRSHMVGPMSDKDMKRAKGMKSGGKVHPITGAELPKMKKSRM